MALFPATGLHLANVSVRHCRFCLSIGNLGHWRTQYIKWGVSFPSLLPPGFTVLAAQDHVGFWTP